MDLDRVVVVCRSSEGLDLCTGLGDAQLEVAKRAWRRILGGVALIPEYDSPLPFSSNS